MYDGQKKALVQTFQASGKVASIPFLILMDLPHDCCISQLMSCDNAKIEAEKAYPTEGFSPAQFGLRKSALQGNGSVGTREVGRLWKCNLAFLDATTRKVVTTR